MFPDSQLPNDQTPVNLRLLVLDSAQKGKTIQGIPTQYKYRICVKHITVN